MTTRLEVEKHAQTLHARGEQWHMFANVCGQSHQNMQLLAVEAEDDPPLVYCPNCFVIFDAERREPIDNATPEYPNIQVRMRWRSRPDTIERVVLVPAPGERMGFTSIRDQRLYHARLVEDATDPDGLHVLEVARDHD